MPYPTVLLVSEEAGLIRNVEEVIGSIDALAFTLCRTVGEASEEFARNPAAILLVHLPADGDDVEAGQLLALAGAARPPCPTLVLADEYRDRQAVALLRAGAADYLRLPADL